eukprot:6186071-Pleurochrysis_carterae.AAC.3
MGVSVAIIACEFICVSKTFLVDNEGKNRRRKIPTREQKDFNSWAGHDMWTCREPDGGKDGADRPGERRWKE